MKSKLLIFTFSLLSLMISLVAVEPLKIGTYENPPKIFIDENGKISGFWADIMKYIAEQENWEIEWVHGNWDQCLQRLENNEIEIMVDVGLTPARQERFAFNNETVLMSWTNLYTKEGTNLQSILDLKGKKIAGLKGSLNIEGPDGLKEIIEKFELNCDIIEMENYSLVFESLDNGEVFAGITNKDFGSKHETYYKVERTPIIFQPVHMQFAFNKNSKLTQHLVERTNYQIKELKKDKKSIYYRSLDKYLGGVDEVIIFPYWAKILIAIIFILAVISLVFIRVLKHQVNQKSMQLQHDIAKRKKAEEALRKSEEKYRLLAEQSGQMMYDYDISSGKIKWSGDILTVTGYTIREFQEVDISNWEKLIHHDDRKNTLDLLDDAMMKCSDYQLEYRFKRKDGKYIYIEDSGIFLADENGKAEKMLGLMKDIAERKRAEDILRESEEKYKSLYEKSADAVLIYKNRRFIDFNQAALNMLHMKSKEQFLNCKAADISPEFQPDGRQSEEKSAEMDAIAFEKGNHRFEWIHKRADGEEFPVEVMLTSIKEKDIDEKYFHVVWRDITERKKAELELKKHREHLEELVKERTAILEKKTASLEKYQKALTYLMEDVNKARQELEITKSRLEISNRDLEAFAYSVSHDLRAPLRHIDGFAELLISQSADQLDEKGRSYLGKIIKASRNMGTLIDGLLTFSRIGRQEIFKIPVELNPMIESIRDEFESELKDRKVSWQIDQLGTGRADPTLLKQVFVNLMSNALKFTKPRKEAKIEIGLEKSDENEKIIYVKDNGVGFDMKYADKLFGVFQRLHSSGDFEGIGIGLANVQRIINRHGGRVWAESEPDKGATFYFSLPNREGED